ncbi:MAG: helix-turn-helix domain-containing protein [Bacteroidales bacterium]|nr:helix-turn-helix domain-containing protein [Bacteroidales bacterium]
MSKPKHISEILREMAENPQNGFEKVLAQLPCMQTLLQNSRRGIEAGETSLSDWIDNQDVMQILHISPRTLQTLRSNGILPFSRIGNKLFYRRQDIIKILSDNYTMRKIHDYGSDK